MSDWFEIIKKKIDYKYSSLGDNVGNIPLLNCAKNNKSIVRYVDKEEYEGDIISVVKDRDATAGYCYHHNGKLAWSIHIYVIQLKQNKVLNLDINAKLLTLQLCPNHLENERLNSNFLNEKYCYLYI